MWTGLAATAVVTVGAATWAILSQPDATPESEAKSAARTAAEANALLQAGILQGKYQDSDGAARTYKRVLELDPGNKFAWYNLGVIAQRHGRAADARAAYDKALKTDPSFGSALFNKAMLLKSSEPGQALELLKRAIAANPKAATAHLHLGLILAKKDRDDEAEKAFRRAVAADPSLHSQLPESFKDSVIPSPTSSEAGTTR
ncbi:tetratricopeptide repeat protein [Streptomyces sp. NPDC005407]|uniref:tetratricopeptide repeat protein n=1 Tax=Streptomyces sp. NPDC005407 TaxID=3155340 RepID=UPI0033BEFC72